MKNKICGIILASGLSKRFGANKLILDINGKPMCEYIIKACKNSNLDNILVVTCYQEVIDICKKYNCEYTFNQFSHLGQSQSIKLGVSNRLDYDGLMFFPCDIPQINPEYINFLIESFKGDILVPVSDNGILNPLTFPKHTFNDLLNLSNDIGGKSLLSYYKHTKIRVGLNLFDIDTPDDYKKINRGFLNDKIF